MQAQLQHHMMLLQLQQQQQQQQQQLELAGFAVTAGFPVGPLSAHDQPPSLLQQQYNTASADLTMQQQQQLGGPWMLQQPAVPVMYRSDCTSPQAVQQSLLALQQQQQQQQMLQQGSPAQMGQLASAGFGSPHHSMQSPDPYTDVHGMHSMNMGMNVMDGMNAMNGGTFSPPGVNVGLQAVQTSAAAAGGGGADNTLLLQLLVQQQQQQYGMNGAMHAGLGVSGPGVVTTLAPAAAVSPATCLGLVGTWSLQQLQFPQFQQQQQQQQQVQGVMQLLQQQQQQQLQMHPWPQ
jgi:hypothetical protein